MLQHFLTKDSATNKLITKVLYCLIREIIPFLAYQGPMLSMNALLMNNSMKLCTYVLLVVPNKVHLSYMCCLQIDNMLDNFPERLIYKNEIKWSVMSADFPAF